MGEEYSISFLLSMVIVGASILAIMVTAHPAFVFLWFTSSACAIVFYPDKKEAKP